MYTLCVLITARYQSTSVTLELHIQIRFPFIISTKRMSQISYPIQTINMSSQFTKGTTHSPAASSRFLLFSLSVKTILWLHIDYMNRCDTMMLFEVFKASKALYICERSTWAANCWPSTMKKTSSTWLYLCKTNEVWTKKLQVQLFSFHVDM